MKRTLSIVASISLCAGLYAPAAISETVAIPLGKQGDYWNVQRPKTGVTKAQVMAEYGEPTTRSGPVGEPPIYTWKYAQFIVYFEGEHVIHSVVVAQ